MLSGCSINKSEDNTQENYLNLIETLNEHTTFSETSNNFSIACDIAKTDDAYRYYVIIDNPRNAMYGVEAVAIEKGVDYSLNMAANVGIFENREYNLVPGLADKDKGYVSGLSISAISATPNPELYVLVQWHSKKQEVHQEFFKLNAVFEGNND